MSYAPMPPEKDKTIQLLIVVSALVSFVLLAILITQSFHLLTR